MLRRQCGTPNVDRYRLDTPRPSHGGSLYLSLFISAFMAATILPAQSEAILAYQLSINANAFVSLVAVATVGNVLGAIVNWSMGRFFTHYRNKTWFPVKMHKLKKAEQQYSRYGRFSLLLSWVPFIGDPITIVAGVLREPLWSFVLLVTIAKGSRYMIIAIMMSGVT